MNLSIRTVLILDLNRKKHEIKTYADMSQFIGGVGIGIRLLHEFYDKDPIIFSIGPLNGYFPFASKTAIIINNEGIVEDVYIGGSLSARIKFAGLDAICICGKSEQPVVIDIKDEEIKFFPGDTDPNTLGLPGKRSIITWRQMDQEGSEKKLHLDKYFTVKDRILESKFIQKNIKGLAVTGTKTFALPKNENYLKVFKTLLDKTDEIRVKASDKPSCYACPLGCSQSKFGEVGGNIIPHCLVACGFADKLFSDVGTVFSCLNTLGYDYKHEDIEALPSLLNETLKLISKKQLE